MYHIMIVEDDENTRQELEALLGNALYEVTGVRDFASVPEQIKKVSPDLVLLDLNLPGKEGIAICRELRKASDVPVIFVTGSHSSMDELNCMLQGGDDFVAKPYQPSILLARIAAVLKRAVPKAAERIRFTHRNVVLDISSAMLEANGQKAELSKNEMKILHYLFRHPDSFVQRADLVDYLWDNQVFIDDNTLSVNIARIRGKLERLGMKGFIETKRGIGYKI